MRSLRRFGHREIKKDRYIYYHCTFDKGSCGGSYVREEDLERQFEEIFDGFRFSEVIVDWVRDGLRQSQKEKAALHNRAIKKLHADYEKLQHRLDKIYFDKLDGEIEDTFYRKNVKEWQNEQDKIQERINRHKIADRNYIEQGIKLLELTQNATDIFRQKSQEERTELLRFVMQDSSLKADTVIPAFKPPFDIIRRLAEDAKTVAVDEKTAVPSETACIALLPRLDSYFLR